METPIENMIYLLSKKHTNAAEPKRLKEDNFIKHSTHSLKNLKFGMKEIPVQQPGVYISSRRVEHF